MKNKGIGSCEFYFGDCMMNRKKLFEEAISSSKHGKVLYISKEELNELPELSQDLSSVDCHYMKMISFLYVNNIESLIETISSLHNWQNVPSTLILEDLSLYCGNDHIQNACGVIGFLKDTVRGCEIVLERSCKLLVSVSKNSVGDEYCTILSELYS